MEFPFNHNRMEAGTVMMKTFKHLNESRRKNDKIHRSDYRDLKPMD